MSVTAEIIPFKQTPQATLNLHVFRPDTDATCAIVFFVCGGWNGFDVTKYFPQSAYFAKRGVLCATAEVRTDEKHGTRPHECVIDAKSAIRFVRSQAKAWNIPADKIVAAGGSAAGHVSLSTAMLSGYEESSENSNISSAPNLVCAYNPAVLPPLNLCTSTPERITSRLEKFGGEIELMKLSPTMAIKPGAVPTLLLHGDADDVTPLADTQIFYQRMLEAKNDCKLIIYPKAGHGFFNYGNGNNHYFFETTAAFDDFLVAHKFLNGSNSIEDFHYTNPV